ncbi:DNA helicase PIF1, ATP-dependent [Corchorus olitorius]|uniref:ATP-dependent DNA helicase n=1 Tax=Corchorus olitorius TaxID=93759 RepID=A0A1R3HW71_9ROSI|nr:DNA helicase PIF1, ATP-dependent [Corchorus olitorius]
MDPKSSVSMNPVLGLSFDGPLCQHGSLSCAVCCFPHGRPSRIPVHDAPLCEGFVPATPLARGRALRRRRASSSLSPTPGRYPRLASVGSSSAASNVVGSCIDACYPSPGNDPSHLSEDSSDSVLVDVPVGECASSFVGSLVHTASSDPLPPTSPYLVDNRLALEDPLASAVRLPPVVPCIDVPLSGASPCVSTALPFTDCLIDVPIQVSCSTLASPMSADPAEPGQHPRQPDRRAVSKPVAHVRCRSSPASRCSRRMRELQTMDVAAPSSAYGCSESPLSPEPLPGSSALHQADHIRTFFDADYFGPPDVVCHFCGASMWMQESVGKHPRTTYPLFSLCCKQGMIALPSRRPTPLFLDSLLDPNGGPLSRSFRDNIRLYNSLFQFTSLGGEIDNSVNTGSGPYIFRLNNQTYHRIGPLLPGQGKRPQFAQLYIYDCGNEVSNRVYSVTGHRTSDSVNELIVEGLLMMLDSVNEVTKLFRSAKERIDSDESKSVHIRLINSRGSNPRTYSLPTSTQVGGLIVGDIGRADGDRDVVVEHKDGGLQHFSTVHPLYMALQYPLLFPYGEDGFTPHIRYIDSPVKEVVRKTMSMREYYAYYLQQRSRHGETLLRGGRLFQQFCVDALSSVQEGELLWLKNHQTEICADMYTNVRDLIHRGDVDASAVGKRIILPATFTGGPRYLYQKYQDAMAICRAFCYPQLFITFTCNGNWPELKDALAFYPGLRAEDRPDLVARVFHIKLRIFLDYLIKRGHFGHALAGFNMAANIDRYVSAEIPDKDLDPIGYEAVTSFMMHGPCGSVNPRAPCMEKQKCDKYVVPHNVDILVRFQAHINVEVCNQSRAIKYLFKYINKGPDRSKVVIETKRSALNDGNAPAEHLNEIQTFLDCRYLCAYEACWRLFSFDIHFRQPAVLRLLVHLPDRQQVYFNRGDSPSAVISRPVADKTMFTEWLVANREYEFARHLLYADFPSHFVWHADIKKWEPRRRGKCIGRVIQINAVAGELYYLRLLLNVVRGPKCFEDIRTVNGVLYDTFQAACKVYGLIGNDKEWNDAMAEADHVGSSYELRQLFVMILVFCQVTNPLRFFDKHWRLMADDIEHGFRRAQRDLALTISDDRLRGCVLSCIDDVLHQYGTSLEEKNLPLPPFDLLCNQQDRLIFEEISYDRDEMKTDHSRFVSSLNPQQQSIFQAITESVAAAAGKMFFVHGHGGTGKTFLWKAVLADTRLNGHIALAVASSGIAALLLPGGRTAHSRFRIPLSIDQWSTCEMRRGTQLAKLMEKTALIVWDEAPMMHRHCIEALDRSLRDIRGSLDLHLKDQPFGGITVVFGGDLRQILPVIPGASRTDVVSYTICNSPLWKHCQVLHLTVNMRLLQSDVALVNRDELSIFSRWIIDVGDGNVPSVLENDDNEGDLIQIPDVLLIKFSGDPLQAIIQDIFPNFVTNFSDQSYLKQRAIITPFNAMVDTLNECMLDLIPGSSIDYYSKDRVGGSISDASGEASPYPIEFLNSITSPGVPGHRLSLKLGCVVMLLLVTSIGCIKEGPGSAVAVFSVHHKFALSGHLTIPIPPPFVVKASSDSETNQRLSKSKIRCC